MSSESAHGRQVNFGPGPAALPTSVLEEASKGILNFQGTGIGISEISHRSKEFVAYLENLKSLIREQLDVPESHAIMFTQGGGSAQFSAVAMNMLSRYRLLHPNAKAEDIKMDYVVTGRWSEKAAEEARRLGGGSVNVVVDSRKYSATGKLFDNIPPHEKSVYNFSPDPALICYCENETVDGVEFSHEPTSPAAFPFDLLPDAKLLPLVADYSSSFMCRTIPRLADHAIIFAGAQKNVGPAGLTILIVRKDCIVDVDAAVKFGASPVPLTLSYKTLFDTNSLYNTPPVFSMYVTGLVLEHLKALGGMPYFEELNRKKFTAVYEVVKKGAQQGTFQLKVKEGSESWMNVVFDIPDEAAKKRFLDDAKKNGLLNLAGHRLVGGIRVSLYNAITLEQTLQLVDYCNKFLEDELKSKAQ
ncbi:Phosphoserine transaminase [Steccherinum ochraceum]|uniref:phosphoserine transaminase n=1 Tax=Steccherinum ochraceum TaxID=92696 RepID=A0A4R0RJT3_9APHY|nr:Phosphoserine transaminase [Steccherinum ochraceum]